LRRSRASSASLAAEVRQDLTRRPRSLAAEPPSSGYIEVTITISPTVADLVSALLFESGATAVVVSELPRLKLRTYLPDDATLEAKLTRVRTYLVALRSMGLDPGPSKVVTRPFHDRGWAMRWKEFFRPVRIGRRLVVTPSWEAFAGREGDIVVTLDPGMAFGTGQHPTTKMCLELLEEAFEEFRVHRSEFRVVKSHELSTMNYELRTMNRGRSTGLGDRIRPPGDCRAPARCSDSPRPGYRQGGMSDRF
jgi:hypothetical protein